MRPWHPSMLLALSILTLLSACAQREPSSAPLPVATASPDAWRPPTAAEIAQADYGAVPDDFQKIIQQHMAPKLFDPYSAHYHDWRGPTPMWWGLSPGLNVPRKTTVFGYGVCVDINAKNRLGGYTGRQRYFFLLRNHRVVVYLGGPEPPPEINKLCAKFGQG